MKLQYIVFITVVVAVVILVCHFQSRCGKFQLLVLIVVFIIVVSAA